MNRAVITGYLLNDPELKILSNGSKVTNFAISTGRRYLSKATNQEVDERVYVDCEVWDTGAETIVNNFKKGDPIELDCSLKMDRWQDQSGKTRSKIKLRVNKFEFPPRRVNHE